jgi:hypothetical protein
VRRASLFLGPGFWGHQVVDAVVDDELAVVFVGMRDQAVGQVVEPVEMRAAIIDGFHGAFVALALISAAPSSTHLVTKATRSARVLMLAAVGSSA